MDNLQIGILIMSGALFFVAYSVMNAFMGQGALEDEKLRIRIKSLVQIRRQSVLRKSNISSIQALNELLGQNKALVFLEELLHTANLRMTPMIFILFDLVLFFAVLWMGSIMMNNVDTSFLFALIAASLPLGFLWLKKGQYTIKFVQAFPDALGMMKNSVRSGQGIQSAFRTVAEEGPAPVNVEFQRIMREIEMGGHLDESLEGLYNRLKSVDVRLFVLGILIQGELGGNIGELLENVSKTIRERITLNREIKALTSQAKSSAIILVGLPVFITVVINFISPGYFDAVLKDPAGQKIFAGAFVWLAIGAAIVTKMTSGVKLTG